MVLPPRGATKELKASLIEPHELHSKKYFIRIAKESQRGMSHSTHPPAAGSGNSTVLSELSSIVIIIAMSDGVPKSKPHQVY